jgi:hypothetical protein
MGNKMGYLRDWLIAVGFLALVFSTPKINKWLRIKWNLFILCL